MSNSRIRRIFFNELKNGLTMPNGKLQYPVLQSGIVGPTGEEYKVNDSHYHSHLIPAPAESETLQGDHVRYMGIYQIDAFVLAPMGGVVDNNIILDEMTDKLQSIFKINSLLRLTPDDPFYVQVISPLKVMEAKKSDGNWWRSHCYFDYRADTNI